MKKPIVAIACTTLFAAQAFAQANNFAGPSIGLRVDIADTTSEVNRVGFSANGTDRDTNAALQAEYAMAMNSNFVLGLGASVGLGDFKAGMLANKQAKLKDSYSLYVAPGYAFNSGWLGYGKLSYVVANVQVPGADTVRFDSGYGLGLGLRVNFDRNWYGQAELSVNQYNDRNAVPGETEKLKASMYSLTAGYRF